MLLWRKWIWMIVDLEVLGSVLSALVRSQLKGITCYLNLVFIATTSRFSWPWWISYIFLHFVVFSFFLGYSRITSFVACSDEGHVLGLSFGSFISFCILNVKTRRSVTFPCLLAWISCWIDAHLIYGSDSDFFTVLYLWLAVFMKL